MQHHELIWLSGCSRPYEHAHMKDIATDSHKGTQPIFLTVQNLSTHSSEFRSSRPKEKCFTEPLKRQYFLTSSSSATIMVRSQLTHDWTCKFQCMENIRTQRCILYGMSRNPVKFKLFPITKGWQTANPVAWQLQFDRQSMNLHVTTNYYNFAHPQIYSWTPCLNFFTSSADLACCRGCKTKFYSQTLLTHHDVDQLENVSQPPRIRLRNKFGFTAGTEWLRNRISQLSSSKPGESTSSFYGFNKKASIQLGASRGIHIHGYVHHRPSFSDLQQRVFLIPVHFSQVYQQNCPTSCQSDAAVGWLRFTDLA